MCRSQTKKLKIAKIIEREIPEKRKTNLWKRFCQFLSLKKPKKVKADHAAMPRPSFGRTASMSRQYIDGFNSCGGFWGVVEKNSKPFLPIYCHTETLTRQNMQALYNVKFSPAGSNWRDLEEETIFCWECLLMAIHEGSGSLSFAEILVFVTGADGVPPLDFDAAPSIDFFDQVEGERRLPFASTCSMILSLLRRIEERTKLMNSWSLL